MMQLPRGMVKGIGLVLLLGLLGCASAGVGGIVYQVGDLQAGDEVSITATGRDVVIDIHSEKGIGSAEIVRTGGPEPEELLLRFFLAGLEELRLTYGDTEVIVRVSSLGGYEMSQEVRLHGGEMQVIGPGSPYWMAVHLPGDSRVSPMTLPIEVTAPRALLAIDISRFSLRWIDFYR